MLERKLERIRFRKLGEIAPRFSELGKDHLGKHVLIHDVYAPRGHIIHHVEAVSDAGDAVCVDHVVIRHNHSLPLRTQRKGQALGLAVVAKT